MGEVSFAIVSLRAEGKKVRGEEVDVELE